MEVVAKPCHMQVESMCHSLGAAASTKVAGRCNVEVNDYE